MNLAGPSKGKTTSAAVQIEVGAKGAAAGGKSAQIALAAQARAAECCKKSPLAFSSPDFYTADGKFDERRQAGGAGRGSRVGEMLGIERSQ